MVLLILFVTSIIISASLAIEPQKPGVCYSEDDRYFYFPGDGDGIIHVVDRQTPLLRSMLNIFEERNNNSYGLYTRMNTNAPEILVFNDERSVIESNFNTSKITVFLVHGWKGHGRNDMNLLLIEAFLQDNDVNVIALDYSSVSDLFYTSAVLEVPKVGYYLGMFINWLTELGVSYENVHLVGFSLGAHVVGNAGRYTQGKVKRITALDPAGPLWYDDDNCLAKSDGQYVEIIHTNTLLFGYNGLLGDADFFPNGGSFMPGCLSNACSHSLSYEYMALTVNNNNIYSNKCNNLNDIDLNTCSGDPFLMGNNDLRKYGDGIFRVNIDDTTFQSISIPMLKFENIPNGNGCF